MEIKKDVLYTLTVSAAELNTLYTACMLAYSAGQGSSFVHLAADIEPMVNAR